MHDNTEGNQQTEPLTLEALEEIVKEIRSLGRWPDAELRFGPMSAHKFMRSFPVGRMDTLGSIPVTISPIFPRNLGVFIVDGKVVQIIKLEDDEGDND